MTQIAARTAPHSIVNLYRHSIEGCTSAVIGKHGLSPAELDRWLARIEPHLATLRAEAESGSLPLLSIPYDSGDIEDARSALRKLSSGARTIVFFGTGGSSLGGQMLAQFSGWNIPGGSAPEQKTRPRTRFYDNLDGATLASALAELDLARTRFVVTSKSGGTTETLAQVIATLTAVERAGLKEKIPELFLGITEPAVPGKANGLRALFESLGIPLLEHHTGIGGRFSCLTNVGMLPAMSRGMDAGLIRKGAADIVDGLLAGTSTRDFAPALGAANAVALNKERGIRTLVLMPYADRLGRLAHWYVQLWAESLGKSGEGTTPIAAMGPLDQHSQLQLYMDGPREICVNVIRTSTAARGPLIDAEMAARAGVPFIGGHTVGDIVDAQAHAVPEALAKAGRPVRAIDLPSLDERSVGQLLMHFMLETILAGRLLGIDPFDQPAVELAKTITKERLKR